MKDSLLVAPDVMPSEIWSVRARRAAILVVRGELSATLAAETVGEVMKAIGETSPDRILIDLADVTFMDSAGHDALIRVQEIANALRIAFAIVAPSEGVRRFLRLMQMDGFFRTYDCLDAALDDPSEVRNTGGKPR